MDAAKLPITGPCPIDLDAIGFDRSAKVAHCSHCVKSVTILSNMTREEARTFLREHQGQTMCVSYTRDRDGRIRFREPVPPPAAPVLVPVARLRARPSRRAGSSRRAGLVAALGVSAALAACTPHGEPPTPTPAVVATPEPVKPDPTPKPTVSPEPVPLAGAAVIPEHVIEGELAVPEPEVLDGELAVPEPSVLDEPCDPEAKGTRTAARNGRTAAHPR